MGLAGQCWIPSFHPSGGFPVEKFLHVFVCSTYRDLVSERNAVLDGLEWLRTQFPAVTYFCPRNILPLEVCKEEIGRSDVLVLILGHLHGVIAPGMEISHGEAEYLEGIARKKKVLVFLRDEKVGIFPVHFERDRNRAAQLKAFKELLVQRHGAKVFTDLQSLVTEVNLGLSKLAADAGLEAKPGSKTAPMRVKGWETRKLPMYAGTSQVDFIPSAGEENPTRTIPILQKALTTPFRHRRSSGPHVGRAVILTITVVVASALLLAFFQKLPFSRVVSVPQGSTASLPGSEPAAGDPAGEADGANPAGLAPAPVPAPKKEGTLVMMEDPDTVKTFIAKAQDGTPEEQMRVARMYEDGQDVKKNDTTAFRWYKKAADRGNAEAEYKVALMYRWGKGTVKSSYQAAKWFQSAADHGHAKAQVKLGQMYQAGKGVAKNETMAFKLFLKAADQKDPEAEKILAELKED